MLEQQSPTTLTSTHPPSNPHHNTSYLTTSPTTTYHTSHHPSPTTPTSNHTSHTTPQHVVQQVVVAHLLLHTWRCLVASSSLASSSSAAAEGAVSSTAMLSCAASWGMATTSCTGSLGHVSAAVGVSSPSCTTDSPGTSDGASNRNLNRHRRKTRCTHIGANSVPSLLVLVTLQFDT